MAMRNLITGGAGFVGSHLAELLLAEGEEVWAIDDLSTGGIRNIDPLKAHPNFHYVVESIFNEHVLAEHVDRCDRIFHLAAAVGVRLIVDQPVHTIETNIRGTERVFRAASKKLKPVLLTSTSEVYGKASKVPFSEDDDMVLGPTSKSRWSYACSKAIDEFLAIAYWRERKMPTVVVRLFNTVGPRQTGQYGMVVPRFVSQALAGGPITVYGDGQQSRCFLYVKDAVRALVGLMREPRARGEVVNVGAETEITIEDLAKRVQAIVNPEAKIERITYEKAYGEGFEDMRRRVPDTRKVREMIGWRPTVGIDEVIRSVADHMRQNP